MLASNQRNKHIVMASIGERDNYPCLVALIGCAVHSVDKRPIRTVEDGREYFFDSLKDACVRDISSGEVSKDAQAAHGEQSFTNAVNDLSGVEIHQTKTDTNKN